MTNLLLFTLLFPIVSFGQNLTSTETGGGNNIYNDAIKRYIAYNTKGAKGVYDTLFLQQDIIISNDILSFKQKSALIALEPDDARKKLETQSSFILHRLFPLEVNNGYFVVRIVPFIVRQNGNEMTFSNAGGYNAVYSYSSTKRRFTFIQHSLQGF